MHISGAHEVSKFILHPQFVGGLLVVKIVFLIFSALFAGFIVWALINTSWLKRLIIQDWKEFFTYQPYKEKKFIRKWKEIKERIESGLEADMKLSLIEADELLDAVLKEQGYEGKNLGERLEKLSADTVSNISYVKQAHQVRNDIVHDPAYKLTAKKADYILSIYQKALIDLDAI